jgi:hypothetical protein
VTHSAESVPTIDEQRHADLCHLDHTRPAEYVAVPRRWCVAHHGVMEEDEFCEYADSYETPCVLRRLFIEDPSARTDGPE